MIPPAWRVHLVYAILALARYLRTLAARRDFIAEALDDETLVLFGRTQMRRLAGAG